MERVIIAAAIIAVALVVAFVAQRRRTDPPTQATPVRSLPQQLDREDFAAPGTTFVVVMFSSDTCDACALVSETVKAIEAPDVAFQNVSWQADKKLHARYEIESVPATVIAGPDGAVGAAFLGTIVEAELVEAMQAFRNRLADESA
ncbi:MAG: thioredoxin family protein [Acidimicrobiales bacterium]|nr:thioredoxin family protein [Acidimicrobiales bacterium]